MSFVMYKRFGKQECEYELESYLDPDRKKLKHKQKYLVVVIDKAKKIYEKSHEIFRNREH
jgi:hypothetical protein